MLPSACSSPGCGFGRIWKLLKSAFRAARIPVPVSMMFILCHLPSSFLSYGGGRSLFNFTDLTLPFSLFVFFLHRKIYFFLGGGAGYATWNFFLTHRNGNVVLTQNIYPFTSNHQQIMDFMFG